MSRPDSCVEALLIDLCVGRGYCLPPNKQDELLANVPEDADAFVDAVLVAEGLDPTYFDKHEREEITAMVRDWLFDDGKGRGTKSGLPRAPSL